MYLPIKMIPIRFGCSTNRRLHEREHIIAQRACAFLFPKIGNAEIGDIEWISPSFRLASTSFAQLLETHDKAQSEKYICIIDIGGAAYKDAIDPQILNGIKLFVEDNTAGQWQSCIVICSGKLLKDSLEKAIIDSIRSEKRFDVYFLDGSELPTTLARKKVRDGLELLYRSSDQSIEDIFKDNVVRAPGYFSRAESRGRPYSFQFEMDLCEAEAQILIIQAMTRYVSNAVEIVYYPKTPQWFRNAVEGGYAILKARTEANDSPDKQLRIVGVKTMNDIPESAEKCALFVPYIRSGIKLIRYLERLKKQPEYLWAICSIDDVEARYVGVNVRKVTWTDQERNVVQRDIEFALRIEHASDMVGPVWGLLQQETETFLTKPRYPLSADCMWAMMLEAGFHAESYGPKREFINLLPKFESMVDRNSKFLALQLRRVVENMLQKPWIDTHLIVCVDEPAARKLAQHVVGGAYERAVFISRELLESVTEGRVGRQPARDWKEQHKKELEILRGQLMYARSVMRVGGERFLRGIMIDEIVVSGATFKSLTIVAAELNVDIEGRVAIVRFGEANDDRVIPTRYLYQIPLVKRSAHRG